MKKLLSIAAVAIGLTAANAQQASSELSSPSDEARFQLSLTPDIAIHPRTTTIRGFSLGIWGENPQHGFNLGFVNGSTGESGGFSWALLCNYTESYTGVQWGFVNISRTSFVGWQDGFVNYSRGTFRGFQHGLLNIAQDVTGLQGGIINYTESLHGVQIGVINVVRDNPWFTGFPHKLATGFPFFNWSF